MTWAGTTSEVFDAPFGALVGSADGEAPADSAVDAESWVETRVSLVEADGLTAMGEAAMAHGYLWVQLEPPGPQYRGRLGLFIEESIEGQLEVRGALPPGIQAATGLDASLSDQLYRARLVEHRGIALGVPTLEGIANLGRTLDADDSSVLRWWMAATADRPVRLVLSSRNTTLRVYPSPVLFDTLFEVAPEPVSPRPPHAGMAESAEAMEMSNLPPFVESDEPPLAEAVAAEASNDEPVAGDEPVAEAEAVAEAEVAAETLVEDDAADADGEETVAADAETEADAGADAGDAEIERGDDTEVDDALVVEAADAAADEDADECDAESEAAESEAVADEPAVHSTTSLYGTVTATVDVVLTGSVEPPEVAEAASADEAAESDEAAEAVAEAEANEALEASDESMDASCEAADAAEAAEAADECTADASEAAESEAASADGAANEATSVDDVDDYDSADDYEELSVEPLPVEESVAAGPVEFYNSTEESDEPGESLFDNPVELPDLDLALGLMSSGRDEPLPALSPIPTAVKPRQLDLGLSAPEEHEQRLAAAEAALAKELAAAEAVRQRAEDEREAAEAARREVEAEREAVEEAKRLAAEEAARAEEQAAFEAAEAERLAEVLREDERRAAEEAAEALRVERQRQEDERLELERLAVEERQAVAEAAEAARLEDERLAAEAAEAARLEDERLAAEAAEAARLEDERLAAEAAEAARLEDERLAAEAAALASEQESDSAEATESAETTDSAAEADDAEMTVSADEADRPEMSSSAEMTVSAEPTDSIEASDEASEAPEEEAALADGAENETFDAVSDEDEGIDADEFLRVLSEDSAKAPSVDAAGDAAEDASDEQPEAAASEPTPLPTKKIVRNPFIRMADPKEATAEEMPAGDAPLQGSADEGAAETDAIDSSREAATLRPEGSDEERDAETGEPEGRYETSEPVATGLAATAKVALDRTLRGLGSTKDALGRTLSGLGETLDADQEFEDRDTTELGEGEAEAADAAAAEAEAQAEAVAKSAASAPKTELVIDESDPFNRLALKEWKSWKRNLEAARGPKPLAVIERMFVTDYTRLREAARRGIADSTAVEMLDEWQESFASSYSEAFDALRVRGKRPTMVLDLPELAQRLGRLQGARRVQLLMVDGLRFDLGLMVQDRMKGQAEATLAERLLLWSALPTVTSYQLELLGKGPDGLKEPASTEEQPALTARGRAALSPRRVRTGSLEVLKLDVVEDSLREADGPVMERLGSIADRTADAICDHLAKQAPRTMVVVFGDHGFALDPTKAGTSEEVQQGGASPEEVLVPAFAWLTGATH